MSNEQSPGDGPAASNIPLAFNTPVTISPTILEAQALKNMAAVGSGGDAMPKPVPLPPPPVIDNLKYYSKQHAKLFGRGKLDQHGRKFPVEAAVRKLRQRGRARFVLERTWYSPLCPKDRGVGEMKSVPLPRCLCPFAACICCGGVQPPRDIPLALGADTTGIVPKKRLLGGALLRTRAHLYLNRLLQASEAAARIADRPPINDLIQLAPVYCLADSIPYFTCYRDLDFQYRWLRDRLERMRLRRYGLWKDYTPDRKCDGNVCHVATMMEVEPDGTLIVGDFEKIMEAGETCSIAGDYVTCTCDEEDSDEECCDCIDQTVPICEGYKCKEAKEKRDMSYGAMSSVSGMSGLYSPGLMSPMGFASPVMNKKRPRTPPDQQLRRATLSPCCPGCIHPAGGPICSTCGQTNKQTAQNAESAPYPSGRRTTNPEVFSEEANKSIDKESAQILAASTVATHTIVGSLPKSTARVSSRATGGASSKSTTETSPTVISGASPRLTKATVRASPRSIAEASRVTGGTLPRSTTAASPRATGGASPGSTAGTSPVSTARAPPRVTGGASLGSTAAASPRATSGASPGSTAGASPRATGGALPRSAAGTSPGSTAGVSPRVTGGASPGSTAEASPRATTEVKPRPTTQPRKTLNATPTAGTAVAPVRIERRPHKIGRGRHDFQSASCDVGLEKNLTKGRTKKERKSDRDNNFESRSSGARIQKDNFYAASCAVDIDEQEDTDEGAYEDSEISFFNSGKRITAGRSSRFGSASYAGYSFLTENALGGPRALGLNGSKSAHQGLGAYDSMIVARTGRRQDHANALREAKFHPDRLTYSRDPSLARQMGSDASDKWLGRQLRGIRSSALAAKRNLCQMRDKIMDAIGGSTVHLGSRTSRFSRLAATEPQGPRTVSPPSALVGRAATRDCRAATRDRRARRPDAAPADRRAGALTEKHKQATSKHEVNYGKTHAYQNEPSYEQNESTLDNEAETPDSASAPKFSKGRDRTKRKGVKDTTKRRRAEPRTAGSRKERRLTKLPDFIAQQSTSSLNATNRRGSPTDSTEQRQPAVTSDHAQRRQTTSAPEQPERRKPATSPDPTECRQPAPSSAHRRRRLTEALPDHTDEHRKPTISPKHDEQRQPAAAPDGPEQQQATRSKDCTKRTRRIVVRGDSRAAAVAEAVAQGSSNTAYPVWLRRRSKDWAR